MSMYHVARKANLICQDVYSSYSLVFFIVFLGVPVIAVVVIVVFAAVFLIVSDGSRASDSKINK